MRRHTFSIALSLLAAVASGAIFLDSLIRQFAWVEIAASVVTAFQAFSLSSAIADFMGKKKEPSRSRNSWVVVFALFLIAFYLFTRYSR